MKAQLLREYIIKPSLNYLDMYSESAVNLLLGTCAQESHMGEYTKQIGGGPAIGIYQIEPETHIDVLYNYLNYRPELNEKVDNFHVGQTFDDSLKGSLFYQTLIARLVYYRVAEKLPKADDIQGLAIYWKKYFNTIKGQGKVSEFLSNYDNYIADI